MAQAGLRYQAVVIGGSAGCLDVVLKIATGLSPSGAIIILVVHRKGEPDSILPRLISSRTKMPVKEVEDKEPVVPGCFYIAPPDYHLLLEDETSFSLDVSEKVHYSRPSIDVVFESVAAVFGERCIGVLLSGANADGAEGLKKIKAAGGYTLAQNPATAEVGFMPQQAINLGVVDRVANAEDIAGLINQLLKLA